MVVIDVQVGASGDDGYWAGSTFSDAYESISVGTSPTAPIHSWARWVGFALPANAIILNAHISVYFKDISGSPTATLYFNDAASPTAPTSYTDANSKVTTTANIVFNPPSESGWNNSGDISDILNELLTSYGTLTALMMLWKGPAPGSSTTYGRYYSYDRTGNVSGPKLYIEYILPSSGGAQIIGLEVW